MRTPRALLHAALALLAAALPAGQAAAQGLGPAAAERDRGWVAFGVGLGVPYDLAGSLTVNVGRARVLQAGLHASADIGLGGPAPRVSAAHVGAGLSRADRWTRLAVAVGPALVWGLRSRADRASGHGMRGYATVGGVVSAQVAVTPVREFGVGLSAFVIGSGVRSGAGLALTMVLEGNK